MFDLNQKTAVITGGASGIGRAAAALFAEAGAKVAIVDIDESGGLEIQQEIVVNDGKALFSMADVTNAVACQSVIQKTVETFGAIDILFNCAGIIRRSSVLNSSEDDWDLVMAVNVKSVFLMSKYAIPWMKRAGGGVILNTASGWGLVGGRDAASYCASKGAVVNLTRAMSLDHGMDNIRVNCICPGDTDTPMLREEARQVGLSENTFFSQAADRPLGRIGTPQEIAQTALFLCSDAASFITGSIVTVDGGGTAG